MGTVRDNLPAIFGMMAISFIYGWICCHLLHDWLVWSLRYRNPFRKPRSYRSGGMWIWTWRARWADGALRRCCWIWRRKREPDAWADGIMAGTIRADQIAAGSTLESRISGTTLTDKIMADCIADALRPSYTGIKIIPPKEDGDDA